MFEKAKTAPLNTFKENYLHVLICVICNAMYLVGSRARKRVHSMHTHSAMYINFTFCGRQR